jgi:Asp-tRNA(Asn)/Glu-tRNA(Gln) amidotransferase A subunit family amidase
VGSSGKAQPGPYTQYLKTDALKGKRFGVPACVLSGAGIPFQGIPASTSEAEVKKQTESARLPLRPETRAAFMKALDGLRSAGATVVFDDSILGDDFAATVARVGTVPYIREGTEKFLGEFGPAQYRSVDDYRKAVGSPLPATIIGGDQWRSLGSDAPARPIVQAVFETDPQTGANVVIPRQKALDMYGAALDRLHLDGYVYPAAQMPPPDETMPQDGRLSEGPHSATGWVNMIGVPAVVAPGGFYPSGLPFGLEISARLWRDGDLLGWAYAYEQGTHHRKPPVLVEKGLLAGAR